jgi:RNA polymerase sigma-70 factor (ECF subfamily)
MHPGDAELLNGALRGEVASFDLLYRRHRTPLFRFAWRLTGSTAAAEDVTQECFLSLLAGSRFDAAHGSLRTYLFGIARHLAMRRLRVDDREAESPEADELPACALDPLDGLLAQERAALVEQAVLALPPLQREALILFEYEDLSLEEIATVVGVDVGAVKSRLHRARQALRRKLAPCERSCS